MIVFIREVFQPFILILLVFSGLLDVIGVSSTDSWNLVGFIIDFFFYDLGIHLTFRIN